MYHFKVEPRSHCTHQTIFTHRNKTYFFLSFLVVSVFCFFFYSFLYSFFSVYCRLAWTQKALVESRQKRHRSAELSCCTRSVAAFFDMGIHSRHIRKQNEPQIDDVVVCALPCMHGPRARLYWAAHWWSYVRHLLSGQWICLAASF